MSAVPTDNDATTPVPIRSFPDPPGDYIRWKPWAGKAVLQDNGAAEFAGIRWRRCQRYCVCRKRSRILRPPHTRTAGPTAKACCYSIYVFTYASEFGILQSSWMSGSQGMKASNSSWEGDFPRYGSSTIGSAFPLIRKQFVAVLEANSGFAGFLR